MADAYRSAIDSMRRQKDAAFREEPWSPIEDRDGFRGLAYYPVRPEMRQRVRLVRHKQPGSITLQTSDGASRTYRNVGELHIRIEGEPATLQAYQLEGSEALFVPFRDATSGKETYGAGRYLDLHVEAGEEVDVDLNLAYNPYCAYNEAFSCPFPPPANWLQVPVRAGERAYEPG